MGAAFSVSLDANCFYRSLLTTAACSGKCGQALQPARRELGSPQAGFLDPAGLPVDGDLAPLCFAPVKVGYHTPLELRPRSGIGGRFGAHDLVCNQDNGALFRQHPRLHPDLVAILVTNPAPAMGFAYHKHRQALAFIPPQDIVFEAGALTPVHRRIAQRLEPWHRLA